MVDGRRPAGPSRRFLRRTAAFVAESWRTLLVDAVVVAGWLLAVLFAFDRTGWPRWTFFLVLFGGIVAYSLIAEWWGEGPN